MTMMIREGYKRLGDYIEPVDERNSTLSVKLSQGICNNKYFITPRQVAENSANDKIVRKGQFAYNRATTRNGDKISIAYREGEDCTVSSAYQVFRIIDENKLNPHYLWMWFRRPEFDRYARFKSRGSAHEFFEWDEMCDVYLPVPDIDVQRRIVAEYQAVEDRIKSNNDLVVQLEETSVSLYNEMLSRECSAKDVKEVHSSLLLSDVADIIMGQSPEGESLNENGDGNVFYQGRTDFGFRFPSIRMYTNSPTKMARKGDVLLSVRAPVGDLNIATCDCCIGRGIASLRSKLGCNSYLYYLLKSLHDVFKVSDGDGTIFGSISKEELFSIKVAYPGDSLVKEFETKAKVIDKAIQSFEAETEQLNTLRALLLAKLSYYG